jgi:hypothetical protein
MLGSNLGRGTRYPDEGFSSSFPPIIPGYNHKLEDDHLHHILSILYVANIALYDVYTQQTDTEKLLRGSAHIGHVFKYRKVERTAGYSLVLLLFYT